MPRILHTADWHLGHRLYDRDRHEEHAAALAWLLDLIREEAVDVVIVAGDVFDKSNPSNQARELYYEFLAGLIKSDCTAAVVVGGNHDSPTMLDAPRGIARAGNVHVVGAAREAIEDQVFKIDVGEGGNAASVIIAAVPYLHERDIRKAEYGESSEDRLAAIQSGILDHYQRIGRAAEALRGDTGAAIIGTGHLFASGATDEEEKKSHIYQADQDNIEAGRFPACFDYVALGHVHRAQSIDDHGHVRYCGSLVPLTFVEGRQPRSVTLVDVEGAGRPVAARKIRVPYFRSLLRVKGDLETVCERLRTEVAAYVAGCAGRETPPPRPWVEIRVLSEEPITNLREQLTRAVEKCEPEEWAGRTLDIRRFNTVFVGERATGSAEPPPAHLDEVDPADVFKDICGKRGHTPETVSELLEDFAALRGWAEEQAAA